MNPGDLVLIEPATDAELRFYRETSFEATAKNYDYFVAMYFRYLELRDQDAPKDPGQYKSRTTNYLRYDPHVRKWKRLATRLDGLLKRKRVPKDYSRTGVLIG